MVRRREIRTRSIGTIDLLSAPRVSLEADMERLRSKTTIEAPSTTILNHIQLYETQVIIWT
jgi:hypothetical protein